jgi:putative cell wall-binding protein
MLELLLFVPGGFMIRRPLRPLAWALAASLLVTMMAPLAPAARGGAPVETRAREVTRDVGREHVIELPMEASHIALHWPGQPNAEVEVALSRDGATFEEPFEVEIDEVGADRQDGRTYGGLIAADGVRSIRVTTDRPIPQLAVLTLDSRERSAALPSGGTARAHTLQPTVIPRSGWKANETYRFDSGGEIWKREFHPIQKLVVHHTAGTNGDPNPEATIRSIYYYHAVTQGWGDIGYNFLIDQSGRVYEGRYSRAYPAGVSSGGDNSRGLGVVAGHARTYNAGTVGVGLLGSFDSQAPTTAARQALVRTLSWLAAKHRIDPRGSGPYVNPIDGTTRSFANIAAHRDLNATACPGTHFYGQLPSIRTQVAVEMVERIGAANRYGTAGWSSARFFAPGAPVAFVATGTDFPDALAAGPVAARMGAPILLVERDRVPPDTAHELSRLRPQQIFVLGGPAVVSDGVRHQVAQYAAGGAIRVSGADRYATAAAISARFIAPEPALVFVATGRSFPDALAGGPAAGINGAPMLLVQRDAIPDATAAELTRLRPTRIVALGGIGVISDAMLARLAGFASQGATRVGGADRYATASMVAAAFFPSSHAAFVATGRNFPDALAAAGPAGQLRAPILLVGSGVPAPTADQLRRLRPARVVILGASGVVSESVTAQIRSLLGLP